MKSQPESNTPDKDMVYTPFSLAKKIIDYLPTYNTILDPCRGNGAFYDQFMTDDKFYCEIQEGRDFFDWKLPVDWIVTNPPWSIYRKFAKHAYTVADNVAFLITINHDIGLTGRFGDMLDGSTHRIKEIILLSHPTKEEAPEWPRSGFQLGVVWKQKGYNGHIRLTDLRENQLTLTDQIAHSSDPNHE